MFTGVCLSTGGSGPGGLPGPGGGAWSRGVGVPAPRGGRSGPGGCLVETPRRLLLWAVRILLECILVLILRTIFWKLKR